MKSVNLVLWALSLGLQLLLVVMLFRRRLVRVVPVFSGLIAFYVLRSAALYVMSSSAEPDDFRAVYDVLSTVDLLLQISLFLEIVLRSSTGRRDGSRRRWGRTAIQVAVEGVIAGAVAYFTPEGMRMPVDRGVVFVTVLMILQLAWILWHRVSGVTRDICAGFALYGSVATAAVFVQEWAIEHRNSAVFTAAGYANGLVYIGVVAFWILALRERGTNMHRRGTARAVSERA